eukprot:COSAG02_NODE_24711_length_679_cov_2.844828_1_plen_189_part_00
MGTARAQVAVGGGVVGADWWCGTPGVGRADGGPMVDAWPGLVPGRHVCQPSGVGRCHDRPAGGVHQRRRRPRGHKKKRLHASLVAPPSQVYWGDVVRGQEKVDAADLVNPEKGHFSRARGMYHPIARGMRFIQYSLACTVSTRVHARAHQRSMQARASHGHVVAVTGVTRGIPLLPCSAISDSSDASV